MLKSYTRVQQITFYVTCVCHFVWITNY